MRLGGGWGGLGECEGREGVRKMRGWGILNKTNGRIAEVKGQVKVREGEGEIEGRLRGD